MCVLGASYAQATSSNNSDLDYTLVPDFGDGVELWGNRDYTVSGIQGTEMCEGGLYLKPNRVKVSLLNVVVASATVKFSFSFPLHLSR